MVEGIIKWFLEDPVKNTLAIIGSGGILTAVFRFGSLWTDRRKIQVRILSETYKQKPDPNYEVVLHFEVINLGEKQTSLEPKVTVKSLTPKAEKRTFVLEVQEPDRQLPPHAPKTFTAVAIVHAVYSFCWFKKFRFRITRGSGSIVRYRNAKNKEIGFSRYWYEFLLFRYFKVIYKAA